MIKHRLALALFALCLLSPPAFAQQSQTYGYLSAASNNATEVYNNGASLLTSLLAINTTTTAYYLKLYNKASAPVCGTDTPVWRIPLPPQAAGGGVVALAPATLRFPLGIGFCLTGGIADSDNSNAAAGVAINFGIAWQ